MQQMKAQVIHRFGAASEFRSERVPVPKPGPGQVLVQVRASSVNTADVKARELGHVLDFVPPLPAILGMDFSGVVAEVGAGVTSFEVGDEVYGCGGGVVGHGGALAEYIASDARLIAHKPKALSMVQAAALPLVSITAWEALFLRMRASVGESILVQGGAGGVGHVAIQLARAAGLNVVATDSGERQMTAIRELGAIPVDYRQTTVEEMLRDATDGKGFDNVFDTVGGANIVPSLKAARLSGQVATTVSLVDVDLSVAHLKGLSLHVIYMLIPMIHNVNRHAHGEILKSVAGLVDSGKLIPRIESVYPLESVADAHRRLERGDLVGKVVVSMGD